MLNYYENQLYNEDVRMVADLCLPWQRLRDRGVMLSGATGLIGSFLIDVLMEKNATDDLNCSVYALGRSVGKAQARFYKFARDPRLAFIAHDVRLPLASAEFPEGVDYVLHLASNTHPALYAADPIGTITTNILGSQNMLEFAVEHNSTRFVFASSNEVYGENRGDVELFGEDYCGYIDCNTVRAGYPESKRCGEALCQAYRSQMGLDAVIARFTRSYGPTMEMSNTRALSQFIRRGVDGKDVVLKSVGTQHFSYTYVADAVSGLLWIMLAGRDGEAYNIAGEGGDITLRDLAATVADVAGTRVVFETPDAVEESGYSRATKARLDGRKLMGLGWKPRYDIKSGVERTVRILRSLEGL